MNSKKPIMAIFLVISLAGCASVPSTDRTDLAGDYASFESAANTLDDTNFRCIEVRELVANEPFLFNAQNHLDEALMAFQKVTKWNADRYLSKNSWTNNPSKPENPYSYFVRELSDPILDSVVQALDKANASSHQNNVTEQWFVNFSTYVVDRCGLTTTLQENESVVASFANSLAGIKLKASQKPWHPKGFTEIPEYTGIAYKPSNRGCTFSFGSCAVFEMVSQTGCPSSLYVQTNLLDNGVVVDWSNDTAVVRPLQVALFETTFSANGSNWEFAEINCY
jgi:hypothetical protein